MIFFKDIVVSTLTNFNILALNIAKRGFFGKSMLAATNEKYILLIEQDASRNSPFSGSVNTRTESERRLSSSGLIVSNNRVNRFVRLVYFLNAAIVLIGLGIITRGQKAGDYRSRRISVIFDEEIWESAPVRLEDGSTEDRLLVYSSFNGVYQGMFIGRLTNFTC